MKIKNIFVSLVFLILFTNCSDQMDYGEYANYDKDDVASSFSRVNNFVTNIYGKLDSGFYPYGDAMLASACDEAEYAWSHSSIHDFYNGAWSSTNAKSDVWSNSYWAIRAVNRYLRDFSNLTFDDFKYNQDYKEQIERYNRYKYEVRFLRAYFYFNLVRQYGDVPFTEDVLTETEANSLSRTPKAQIFDYIVSECDAIANELPVSYQNVTYKETGRITRITVLALKARALLYKASPLFTNGTDNTEYWKEAAIANKAVIDACAEAGIKLGKYTDLWGANNWKASEVIFARKLGKSRTLESLNFPIGVEGGNSGNCPTQTLVDAYEMKTTGKLWNEAGSGYDVTKPYANRDPRLGYTIACNGDQWPYTVLETYIGGANALPISGGTPTGYYLKKYMDLTVSLNPNNLLDKPHAWITYRLGEFYLNYAEAMFRYLKSADATDASNNLNMSACDAVNVIRKRSDVNVLALPAGLSNEAFEKKYMNERMVELAFEGHRFWDVRRWKKGEVLKQIEVMTISKNADDSFTYIRSSKKRNWSEKMYWFPIPNTEMMINPNLVQNPGW